MIVRTYTATVQKKCCRNGEIVYDPPDRDFEITDKKERSDEFEYSLVIWKDKTEESLFKLAELECRKKKTPRLCHFLIKNAEVKEEEIGVPVIVPVPKEIIEAIKGYERSAKSLRETADKLRAIPELVEDFLKRAKELEDKAKELRKKYGLEGKDLE